MGMSFSAPLPLGNDLILPNPLPAMLDVCPQVEEAQAKELFQALIDVDIDVDMGCTVGSQARKQIDAWADMCPTYFNKSTPGETPEENSKWLCQNLTKTADYVHDTQTYRYFEMANDCKIVISGVDQKTFSNIITYVTFFFVFTAYLPVFSKMVLQLCQCLSTCVSKCMSRSTPEYVLLDQKFLDQKSYGSTKAPESGANIEQADQP